MTPRVLLLTGRPGVGKTTILRQAIEPYLDRAGGFYTTEIRQGGRREGFRIVPLDGAEAILASIHIRSLHRVSRYGVDIEALDRVGVAALRRAIVAGKLVVVDEIGKMELFSAAFREALAEAISKAPAVLGTVMLASHPFADAIKAQPEARLFTVTKGNREEVLTELQRALEELVGPGAAS